MTSLFVAIVRAQALSESDHCGDRPRDSQPRRQGAHQTRRHGLPQEKPLQVCAVTMETGMTSFPLFSPNFVLELSLLLSKCVLQNCGIFYSFTYSFIYPLVRSFVCSSVNDFIHLLFFFMFIHPFVYSFIIYHPFLVHAFIVCLIILVCLLVTQIRGTQRGPFASHAVLTH